MHQENAVEFGSICFSHGGQEVLHDISFTIPKRSMVFVVGPNGGGKTTLLKLMLGLLRPERGSIQVLGKEPMENKGRIGYVMQDLQYDRLFPATVMDITLMGVIERSRLGFFTEPNKRKARNVLQLVGMLDFSEKLFSALSGGQQQRVLLAQALVSDPELLLLDEPTANIDSHGEHQIFEVLSGLKEKVTVVIVSHNTNVVLNKATHVMCVNHTATLNKMEDMKPVIIQKAHGDEMALLSHQESCMIFDESHFMLKAQADHSEETEQK